MDSPEKQDADFILPVSEDEGPPEIEFVDSWLLDVALYLVQEAVRGNGLDPAKVSFTGFIGEVLKFEAFEHFTIETQVADKLIHGKENGEVVGGIQDARDKIQQTISKITQNTDIHKHTIELLKKRPDTGLGVDDYVMQLDRQRKTFVVHELCNACAGKMRTPCQHCQGRGKVKCIKCHGTRDMICPQCHGKKRITANKPCARCRALGKIKCDKCRYTGLTPCQNCRMAGMVSCTGCSGTGWHSHVFHLTVKAKSRFAYDREALPEAVTKLIDAVQTELVTGHHVEAAFNETKEKEEELNKTSKPDEFIIPYNVRLPWGRIGFLLDGREIQGDLFGVKPSLVNLPHFLEDLALPGLHALAEAAQRKSGRRQALKVAEAAQTRISGEALLAAGRYNRKRALEIMHERYPFGISAEALEKLTVQAHTAIGTLARGRRLTGLLTGLALAAGLYAAYLPGQLRMAIAPLVPNNNAMGLIDLLVMMAGGTASVMTIRALSAGTLRRALGKLASAQGVRKLVPRTGSYALASWAACLLLYLGIASYSVMNGDTAPVWYSYLRQLAGL